MNQLIPIKNNEDGDIAVSGRDLHDFLEVGTDYRHWIDRMLEYGFTQGADFNMVKNDRVRFEGNRQVTRQIDDAIMTLDMAKEIAMLQRSDKGKQAREYFIACEKQLKQVPQQIAETKLPSQIAAAEMQSMANYKTALLGFIDGLKPDVAEVRTIKHLRPQLTQIDCDDILTLIPGRTDIDDIGAYNATTMGKIIGDKSAKTINAVLEDLGFQTKANKTWKLTEAGTDYGEMLPWENHGRAGFRISWNEKALDALKKYFNI